MSDSITLTEEELVKLMDLSDHTHTIGLGWGIGQMVLLDTPENHWAYQIVEQWRTNNEN